MCGSGIGSEMHRKGSNVLLCFWQCGQVSEDLRGHRSQRQNMNGAVSQSVRGRKSVAELSLPVLSLEELLYKGAGGEWRRRAFQALVVFVDRWLNTHGLQVRF